MCYLLCDCCILGVESCLWYIRYFQADIHIANRYGAFLPRHSLRCCLSACLPVWLACVSGLSRQVARISRTMNQYLQPSNIDHQRIVVRSIQCYPTRQNSPKIHPRYKMLRIDAVPIAHNQSDSRLCAFHLYTRICANVMYACGYVRSICLGGLLYSGQTRLLE